MHGIGQTSVASIRNPAMPDDRSMVITELSSLVGNHRNFHVSTSFRLPSSNLSPTLASTLKVAVKLALFTLTEIQSMLRKGAVARRDH